MQTFKLPPTLGRLAELGAAMEAERLAAVGVSTGARSFGAGAAGCSSGVACGIPAAAPVAVASLRCGRAGHLLEGSRRVVAMPGRDPSFVRAGR